MSTQNATPVAEGEISPSQVTLSIGGTPLRKREAERFLENLLKQQQNARPDRWSSFSKADLAKSMKVDALSAHDDALIEILCDGGRLPSHPTVMIQGGYLERLGTNFIIAEPLREVFKNFAQPVCA